MIGRFSRRMRATFGGPTAQDAVQLCRDLQAEVARLRHELDTLSARVEPFYARDNEFDRGIYHDVIVQNEYRLPGRFAPSDVIIDIGAHIGSFSTACLLRGAGHVASFEPFPPNAAYLRLNMARFGPRSTVHGVAVWRSDCETQQLTYQASHDPENTGGGTFLAHSGATDSASTLSLDGIVRRLLARHRADRIRLVKLDCEGSEYPILLTATCLDKIDELCGEYHDIGPVPPAAQVAPHTQYTHPVLIDHLRGAGFHVETADHPHNPALGFFWARR